MSWLTQDLVGSGGVLLADPPDFVVDEIPAYEPSGEGEHALVHIEKVGLTTPEAIRGVARAFGVREDLVGRAGLKDKHARTTQWLSIPAPIKVELPDPATLQLGEGLRVLAVERHGNKLKRGHLRGNRFSVTVREVPAGGLERAQATLAYLVEHGVPNAFGPQRFGRDGDNAERPDVLRLRGGQNPLAGRLVQCVEADHHDVPAVVVLNSRAEHRVLRVGAERLGDAQKADFALSPKLQKRRNQLAFAVRILVALHAVQVQNVEAKSVWRRVKQPSARDFSSAPEIGAASRVGPIFVERTTLSSRDAGQGFPDGGLGAVALRRVDKIDAQLQGFPNDRDGVGFVLASRQSEPTMPAAAQPHPADREPGSPERREVHGESLPSTQRRRRCAAAGR